MDDTDLAAGPIGGALARRQAAQQALNAAVEDLERTIVEAAGSVDGEARLALLRHLYWERREIRVAVLQLAFEVSGTVASAAGPGPPSGSCCDCEAPLRPTSRSDAVQRERCMPCEHRQQEERRIATERFERHAERLQQAEDDWLAAHRVDPWDDLWHVVTPPHLDSPEEEPPRDVDPWPEHVDAGGRWDPEGWAPRGRSGSPSLRGW